MLYLTLAVKLILIVFFGSCWYQGNIALGNMVALSTGSFTIFPHPIRVIAAWSGSAFQFLLTEKRLRSSSPLVSLVSGAFTVADLIGPMAGYLILWGVPLTIESGIQAALLACYSSWISQHMCWHFIKEVTCEIQELMPRPRPTMAPSRQEVWPSQSGLEL